MSIVVVSDTPHMTKEQYDRVAAHVGLHDSLPQGCVAYVAVVGPDGTTWHDSVWETAAQAKEFMDGVLRPTMEAAGATPIWGPPQTWEVHDLIT
jgi:hypothetical protein